jgi:hypothetical protein
MVAGEPQSAADAFWRFVLNAAVALMGEPLMSTIDAAKLGYHQFKSVKL